MKRKRNRKGRREADNASRNLTSRKDGQKKTNKSGDGGSSCPTQPECQPKDTQDVSNNQNEFQPELDRTPGLQSGKAEAQTQTERLETKSKTTQTKFVSYCSHHTQTETDTMSEATLQGEENSENVSLETKEEKSAEGSTGVSTSDPRPSQKKDTTTLTDSDEKKNKLNEKPGHSGDMQNSSDTFTDPKTKSYAEVASAIQRNKDSKEQSNQAAPRKSSPARGPTGKPMFTFYVNIVLDKSFKFNRKTDKFLLCHKGGFIEMEITLFRNLPEGGYLIEANFLVDECDVQRGSIIMYNYAVQYHKKDTKVNEIVQRALKIPSDLSVKEMYLFEPHVTSSSPGFFKKLISSEGKIIDKAWHNSACVLLDRLFENWHPSNQESKLKLIQLLNYYQRDFTAAGERVVYINNLPTPFVKVNELIAKKLATILTEITENPSESSVDISSVTVGLSVFQVCRGCGVELGIKDWALLCQQVSSDPALRLKGEIQTAFPSLLHTVIGLVNYCAQKLLSELVLLVPLLYSVRQPGADSGKLGPAVEEPIWTGLQGMNYRNFRERIRPFSEKRRMMLKLVKDQQSLAKEKPQILTSWLSLMAFEDMIQFVQLTKIVPEHLIQSLMYRLKDFELNLQRSDYSSLQKNLEVSENILTHLLTCVEQDKERILASELLGSMFLCCKSLHKSTCRIARFTSLFKATILSFQLVLKMAELQYEALSKQEKEKDLEKKELLSQLETIQKEFSEWRDGLLKEPLFKNLRLNPSEIQLWDALLGLECSIQCVTDQWTCRVERDLKKRISELNDEQKVQICSMEISAMVIRKSHNTIQKCFQDLCQTAIKNICQAGKERSLLQSLPSAKSLSSFILSSIIVESAARFGKDPVNQLLDTRSAIHFLLTQGHWNVTLNEDASQVMNMCKSTLCTLVSSLCQGDIPFGHLQIIMKHNPFQELFKQCKKNCKLENISIDVKELLNHRAKDVHSVMQQRAHIDVLIKMIGRISEMVHVPEMSLLEQEHKNDLQSVSLNALVKTQPCFCNEHLKAASTGQVLYYSADSTVLDAAREMYELQESNLILKSWMDKATELAPNNYVSMDLLEVISEIWEPSVDDLVQLGFRIASETVTFEEVDSVVSGCEDDGDGTHIKRELNLMATKLERFSGQEENWPEKRLNQIQEYRQLHHAAASANAILTIRDKLHLQGDFSHISSLTQLNEDSFKKKSLRSLDDDLFSAKQKLLNVNRQHTACLEAFLKSEKVVNWIKSSIANLSELKVFMDLASISAGENAIEIDRLASFGDAVVGYGPLLFSLRKAAGFDEFIACAHQVWEKLKRDEKLPEKLEHSFRCLDWLKGLGETHGSVEKSSLYLVSAINTSGVYHVGWPVGSSTEKCLGNILHVKVANQDKGKTCSLDELLELQNKLMLMSSKKQHGIDQVNKFTEILEGVQRMGRVLMQLCSSGNIFFWEMKAHINCNPKKDACISIHFPLLGKDVVYYGSVAEELQKICRSMEACHEDWHKFMTDMRSRYYALNHFISEQVVYLCFWIKNICENRKPVKQQIWNLLTALKPDVTLKDIRSAYENAKKCPDPDDLNVPVKATTSKLQEGTEEDKMLIDLNDDELEVLNDQDCNMDEAVMETLEDFWQHFRNNMPRYLSQYTDIETLARFLSSLSAMNHLQINRRLPSTFQEGKPNLILCPAADLIMTTLSVYMESSKQTFPSADEILMCHEGTTKEDIEIFLRRCLGQGDPSNHQKIYTLFNPGLLTYDVSVALAERFEAMERSAKSHYRMVLVCPVNQDRYVPSFFSNYKVQAGLTVSVEKAKEYLRSHLTIENRAFPGDLSAWLVTSKRPAVGKSLWITRMFQSFQAEFPEASYLPVRLIEPCVDMDNFIQILDEKQSQLREQDPVLLHIDTSAVQKGLDEFLFKLLVLGCLSDSKGKLWRRNSEHLIAVEALLLNPGQNRQTQKESNQGLLNLLPTICCRPPKEVKQLELTNRNRNVKHEFLNPLMDRQEFESEGVQRPYQYLKRFNRKENLDHFKYQAESVVGDTVDCLHHLLSNCGLNDPSWAELKHFTWFLNLQLKDCEISGFCDPDIFGDSLVGFKNFIVKFMIHMARDFASPSMDLSDQSSFPFQMNDHEDELLARLTIRKRWENESHPYIFFNADHLTMTFIGFHVKQNPYGHTLNAVDPCSGRVLMEDVMSPNLFVGLQNQRITFSEDFDELPRQTKLKKICLVVGAKLEKQFDPDPTYELTADNVMKMLAIHMRFRCEIPVIIMGETGCGKTRLVKFLCDLQKEGRNVENMKLVKVHGGTTADTIHKKVRQAENLALKNRNKYNLDTVLFFDEANTTEAIFAIKEVLCDKTVQGFPLETNSGLKIIAACNPYRRHSPEMIDRLERAGLGYRVKAGETEDRLGKVPMRQLVYRVHPLPPSMMSLVWDFGQLSDLTEFSYIQQIVKKQMKQHYLPAKCQSVITKVLSASQQYMRSQVDECSFVSLRDVERSIRVLVWFYQHRDHLFPAAQLTDEVQLTLKCLVLSVGVCYYPSLEDRERYLLVISQYFPSPLNSKEALEHEISSCQEFFLKNIKIRETIAKNFALKENVFLMVVCIELRIPLFLVGKPGSSKSLAKTVVVDAMQRQNSHSDLFKKLKEVHMVSFQCSPHSSPEGIVSTFRNCARFQKDKNMDEYVSVVVLDEIGLAEDSPQMPLKTLHPLLEDGCIDNETPDPHMKVGFVGISNWALDPAKMNRGIFVSRFDPTEHELVETAKGICSSSKAVLNKINHLLPKLANGFLKICQSDKDQFFGLRDYYSLVKMIFNVVKNKNTEPTESDLAEAILRNFSGQKDSFDPFCYFHELFRVLQEVPRISTLKMIKANLDHHNKEECRYLLLLTTNNAALSIIQQCIFSNAKYNRPEIVFGSGFPKDQEYAQICRNVSRVKTCMETGRTVILLNLLNLYESLYDALNQYYVYFCGQQYVDLGLGSHRVKCRVHKNFRLIVIEDQNKVYEKFPVPLKNRLEKHRVDRSTDLNLWQLRVLKKLKNWVEEFSHQSGVTEKGFSPSDSFLGFHGDACASALLQALERRGKQDHQQMEDASAVINTGIKEGNSSTEPTEVDTMEMLTEGNRKEKQEQEREDIQPHLIMPNKESVVADSEVQSNTVLKIPIDENAEELILRHVGGNEVVTEAKMEALENFPDSMETEMNQSNLESDSYKEPNEDEEEEVYESAKSFLLNCATPDAVLRLKYSELGKQEISRLQRLYFHQQGHHSLRDFMERHLKKPDREMTRFIEVTTFSSLLTKADMRNLTQALGLTMESLVLLSLHQFDTEASFCTKIRCFLQNFRLSLNILLVQVDMEESLCKNELIASAKYCIMNELIAVGSEDCNCYIVFITKLSRIAGGNKYIGFQGGSWLSVHIDDLRDTDDMSLDLSVLCGMPISKLLSKPTEPVAMDIEDEGQWEQSAYLHSLSLLRSCAQKAVSLLRDPGNKTSRSMERIRTLFSLLENDSGHTGARFQQALLSRLVAALVQREDLILYSEDWVNKEAMKRDALQEGGTLRHTLWRYLQGVLTPILARILEVCDRDSNMDLLYRAGLSKGHVQLWLDIFEDEQLQDLAVPQSSYTSDQEIEVQCNLVVGEEDRPCAAPFSWLTKLYCQNLWEESQFVQGIEQNNHERIRQFVSAVTSSRLGSYIENLSQAERVKLGQDYLTDFVLLFFKVKTEEELMVFYEAELGCVAALQEAIGVPIDLSPAWIMAATQRFKPRLDTLSHALQLQPQIAPIILSQKLHKDSHDLHEDIVALGICVEETKLQPITSFSECLSFLRRVELLQPCLQRAYSNTYSSLCSPGCLKHLDAIKLEWQGILVVAAFIEQVVVRVNSSDKRLMALTLQYCRQLQKLMGECPDLQSRASLQRLIRSLNDYHEESISIELRLGVQCPVCLEDLAKPCVLQCEHVVCLACMKRCVQEQRTKCPKCRTELPPNYQPTVSTSVESALKQHKELRSCCNSFFLEVVSRFCFTIGQRPQEDVVELLFSLLISTQGDVYKTRELTPFLECVDQSPVVRSVLPKLLLQYSFDQVKIHIQTYLQNLEGHLLDNEDKTELYRLFVNCFQDSLLCVSMSEILESKELQQRQQRDINFLSRLARRQTPSLEQQPAEFLLSIAHLRMCLDNTARILSRAVGYESGGCVELEEKYLEQVKAVCEYSRNDWNKIYLLKALYRQGSTDFVQAVMNSSLYGWVFPSELLQLQKTIPVEVDRFLCCGQLYKIFRNGVSQVLLDSSTDALKAALQNKSSGSVKSVLLALALFRQITCCLTLPNTAMRPGAQELKILEDLVRQNTKGHLQELCASLLSKPDKSLMPHLHVSASGSANYRRFQELLVHAVAVFHSGNKLLSPLHLIATKPQTMTETFLPTMPDDHTSEVIRWLNREGKLTMYYCANGHPCLVGECGRPMEVAKCDRCKIKIGGEHHRTVQGFTQVHGTMADKTRTGHILNDAAHRSEAPNRNLSMAESCVLRLFLHLALLHGSALNDQGVRKMIHSAVYNLCEFLMHHLEKDMESLGKSLNLNWDDTAITVHLILNALAENSTDSRPVQWGSRQDREQWGSRQDREQWEKQVCKTVIEPILKNLNRHLTEAQSRVAADDNLSNSPLMKVLMGDPRSLLALPSECPSHHVVFWTPPDLLTVERLSQLITQNRERDRVPLLSQFLENVHLIRHLACLPDLAALMSDLMRVVPPDSETTIGSLLDSIPAGLLRNSLTERLKTFFRVWNHLRMELANNTSLGLNPELIQKDITMESSSQYLSLTNHGPGSCLHALINLLSETHNSLVREARKLSYQTDSDYSVPVGVLSENQLALCHAEKELLPLVLAHCHYTLVKGQQTVSDYDVQAIEKQLHRRFVAGKPRIQTDTEKYLKRHHQDFSDVLKDVRTKIPQEGLKGSVYSSMRTVLRSFTDVCDAVHALEIGLRFLGKTGGCSKSSLLSYLQKSLRMEQHISSNVAKALAESHLDQCTATWQLLTCWKSELKLRRGQDPFPKLSKDFRQELSSEEEREVNEFLDITDVELFTLELHEILLLKTDSSSQHSYSSGWDIRTTLESHLEDKRATPLPGLDTLTEEMTLSKAAEVWRLGVMYR